MYSYINIYLYIYYKLITQSDFSKIYLYIIIYRDKPVIPIHDHQWTKLMNKMTLIIVSIKSNPNVITKITKINKSYAKKKFAQ